MNIGTRTVVLAATVAAVGAGAYLILRPSPPSVETALVDEGPIRVTVDEDGETRVENRFVISAPVTGRMERLDCLPGDPVDLGQLVARIYPLPLDSRATQEAEARLQAAEAGYRASQARESRAEAAWGEARRARERLEKVSAEVPGSVSEQRLDQARTLERQAELTLATAREESASALHLVESAGATVVGSTEEAEPTEVFAPAAGRILRVYEDCERVVAAGAPILEIGDPGELEVVADVLTEEASRLKEGARAWVTQPLDPDTLPARIRRIEPSAFTQISPLGVEEQRVNVVLTLDPQAGPVVLGDRYHVQVSMVVWESDRVLRIPLSAIFRLGDGWAVFVVDEGRAAIRTVELGQRGRSHVQVLAGLDPGERVILYPSDEVEAGVRVSGR